MSKDTGYTWIVFNRTDLFEVCKLGLVAQQIGSLWCTGWIPTDRLDQMQVAYRVK